MSKIKVMGETLANKIAAGEIVERISSVVKELVENSIDAKSTSIKVELEESGKKRISVIDNGIGMDKMDVQNCFQRHATSKIYKEDDLYFINTLGFRGEALPSIASVSDVVLESSNGIDGTSIHIKGGQILDISPATLRTGTSIKVSNLFYNTPARLKFLKSENSELASVVLYLEKLALSNPDIAFTLVNNEQKTFSTSGSGDLLKTIHEIYGLEISKNMLLINGENDDFLVNGYIGKPSILRSNRNHMTTFINGRVIKNLDINKMINEAYSTYKPDNLYPIVVINIETDPTLVDVNIHPTKQDVKVSKMDELSKVLIKAIKDALYSSMLIPKIGSDGEEEYSDESIDDPIISRLPVSMFVNEEKTVYSSNTFIDKESCQESIDFTFNDKNNELKKLELYPVGIALGTYIIAENAEGIFLIDQHAAQERINYEKVLKGIISHDIVSMLVPITLELSKSEFEIVKNNIDIIINMGFEISEFGINTFKISAHPSWVKTGKEYDTIKAVIDTIIEEEAHFDPVKFNDKVAATIACKASIKGNSRITLDEAEFLLNELVTCDNPYNCPHGRPTIIKFTKYEIEKMFKRVM